MARLVACADGAFTSAATWATCDANSVLDSEASQTQVLTTGGDSATFVPAAVAIDAIVLKLNNRSGTPGAATFTATLRNSTTATDVASVTVNISDIPASTQTDRNGGWQVYKFGSTHTPNGTDSYLIRLRVSTASGITVNFWTNGTGANWARMLRTTTTAAPAAGDLMIVSKEWTAAATGTTRTVTMDSTATTQYGTTSGLSLNTEVNTCLSICNGGTVTWNTAAATNYRLRMAGNCTIYTGGTMTMGVNGTEMPRDSTAELQFVITSNGDSGLAVKKGGSFTARGLSRTSGKDVSWTLLTADAASAQATASVADDTGWLSGDKFAIAPTSQTASHAEQLALNANAGASSIVASSNFVNAHLGTNGNVAEVGLLTRNVVIRTSGSTASLATFVHAKGGCTFDARWVEFFNMGTGSSTDRGGFYHNINTTDGGSIDVRFCSFWQFENNHVFYNDASDPANITFKSNVIYRAAGPAQNVYLAGNNTGSASTWEYTSNVIIRGGSGTGFDFGNLRGKFNNNRVAGTTGTYGMKLGQTNNRTSVTEDNYTDFHSNHVHSTSTSYAFYTQGIREAKVFGSLANNWCTLWRNSGVGWKHDDSSEIFALRYCTFYNIKAWGNSGGNIQPQSGSWLQVILKYCDLNGDTTFSSTHGFNQGTTTIFHDVRWENCRLGASLGGTKTTHSSADIRADVAAIERHVFNDCTLGSTTPFSTSSATPLGSEFHEEKVNGAAGTHKSTYAKRGVKQRNTAAPLHGTETDNEKLTPNNTTILLFGSTRRVAVASGDTVTVSVWVLKTAAYGETTTPALTLKANPSIGIDEDVTLDTIGAAVFDTWVQLTGTTAAVTGDGVLEFYVNAHGTGGSVHVGQWSAS